MRATIRSSIFLPVVAVLLGIPLVTYLVFGATAAQYMQRQAQQELSSMLRTALPMAQYAFDTLREQEPADEQQQTVEQRQQLAGRFFQQVAPLLQKNINETHVLVLDANWQLLYPQDFTQESVGEEIYHYCRTTPGLLTNTIIPLELEGKRYLASIAAPLPQSDSAVGYLIGYSILPQSDGFLARMGLLVFAITAVLAAVCLPLVWLVAERIASPIRRLGAQADAIGSGQFHTAPVESSLTELAALGNAMNGMAGRLERYDRAQKTFFENASHELRTPLMSIRGYAEGIDCGVFADNGQATQVIVRESDRLAKLVDSLLTLSRLDNLRQQIEPGSIPLWDFAQGVADSLQGMALAAGLVVRLEGDRTLKAVADEELLTKAFVNLLGNALRYARRQVTIRLWQDSASCYLAVCDDGKGIDPRELPNLFQRFYKGEGGQTGLGLSIARSAMEYMGGAITAANGEVGAVFTLSLPRRCV